MPKSILKSNSAFVGIGNPLSTSKTRQRTNILFNSEAFQNWSLIGSTPPTITQTDVSGPFNTQTAERITFGTSTDSRVEQQGRSVTIAGDYVFSIWLRADSPQTIYIGFNNAEQICNVTTEWKRFTRTQNRSVGGIFPQIRKAGTDTSSFSFYAYGAQVERGTVPTNYIKSTTAAVTITEIIDELRLFTLTQNCNFGVTNDLLKLKQIGSDGYAVNEVFQAPKVNLTLDYLHSPYLNNELLLGFNGSGSVYENALSGFNSKNNNFYLVVDNRDFKEGFDEVKRVDPLNIDFSGFSIFSFGDSYLTNYSLNFQIGQVPSVSTTFACSNMKIDTLVDSEKFEIITGSFTWSGARTDAESRGGRLAVLNTEEKNNKVPTQTQSSLWIGATDTGVEGTWRWIDGTLLNDGYTNWSIGEPNDAGGVEDYTSRLGNTHGVNSYKWNDLANTSSTNGYIIEYGIIETKNQITTPSVKQQAILNLADSYYTLESGYVLANPEGLTEFNVPVSSPMHSEFILDDLQVGGIKLESYNNPLLQSLSIDIDLSRNDLYGLGSNYVYDRKLSYPINAKIDMSVLVSGVDDGFISGILSNQQIYAFTIHCINNKNYATGSYKFNNCRLANFNYSMPLNNIMTFNASFDCTIRNDVGFEMKRTIGELGNFYQDFDSIWGNLSINWDSI
jgi:hypothetical protein